jgi:hypothetical protein
VTLHQDIQVSDQGVNGQAEDQIHNDREQDRGGDAGRLSELIDPALMPVADSILPKPVTISRLSIDAVLNIVLTNEGIECLVS